MVTCVASEPKCGGELIEKLRYWVLQIAMMDSILGTCKDIDYNTLKSVVQESGLLNFVWNIYTDTVSISHQFTSYDFRTGIYEYCLLSFNMFYVNWDCNYKKVA